MEKRPLVHPSSISQLSNAQARFRSSVNKSASSFTVCNTSVSNGPFTKLPCGGFYWPVRFLLSSNISVGPDRPGRSPLPTLPVNVQQKDLDVIDGR